MNRVNVFLEADDGSAPILRRPSGPDFISTEFEVHSPFSALALYSTPLLNLHVEY